MDRNLIVQVRSGTINYNVSALRDKERPSDHECPLGAIQAYEREINSGGNDPHFSPYDPLNILMMLEDDLDLY